jgi:hypothetical protein
LADKGGADDLSLGIFEGATVGLVGKGDLRDGEDGEGVDDGDEEPEGESGADGFSNFADGVHVVSIKRELGEKSPPGSDAKLSLCFPTVMRAILFLQRLRQRDRGARRAGLVRYLRSKLKIPPRNYPHIKLRKQLDREIPEFLKTLRVAA